MSWEIVEHACRACGGRVLQDGETFQCSTCGRHCKGKPSGICGCGTYEVHWAGRRNGAGQGKRLPYRCVPNPKRGVDAPAEIVIEFTEVS